jgi:sulfur-oxidizing protein SoxA
VLATAKAAPADQVDIALDRYRAMLSADPWSNPGQLDADRGAALWREPRGPKALSLETCDLGLGPGKVEGAFAELPRYFPDAGQVMDVETRVLWCMTTIQGFDRATLVRAPFPKSGQPAGDIGAIATFIAARSSGQRLRPHVSRPEEQASLALGEALFKRRMGPLDFACSSCHGDSGKRIRRQVLPQLDDAEEARAVVGQWPAYRVSATHVMTMSHRLYDCFWQMRLPPMQLGSEIATALTHYLAARAAGGVIAAPGVKR